MKHLVTYAAILFMISFCLPVQAQIPHTFSFQGVLTDADGLPVEDGIRPVTFALYENELSTVPSWTETQMLDVQNGVFNAMLGTVNPFTIDFDRPWLLGISVDGAEELLPRTPLASAPYAMHAAVAEVAGGLLPGAGGAVTALNALTGAITLEGAGGTTVSSAGNTITISSGTGGAGITRLLNSDGTMSILHPTGPETTLGILDGGITESKLADVSVNTPKLANLAVTMGKLADNAVTTGKIVDAAVTPAKINPAGASPGQVLAYDGAAVAWTTPATSGVTGTAAPGQLAVWDAPTSITGNAELVYDGMKLGVGTAIPEASLHVVGDDGILASGSVGTGQLMNPGAGVRMHWYPRLAAFRAGSVDGDQWDDANVGANSVALGKRTIASEYASISMGFETVAEAEAAIALGYRTKARGDRSIAIGSEAVAAGMGAIALGRKSSAGGNNSVAIGRETTASGSHSTAMGNCARTAGHSGSFVIGDLSDTFNHLSSTAENQMSMRFHGGYRLYSNTTMTTGVYMNSGVSGWSNFSDRNTKENISDINGEEILEKIRLLPVSEWNYIGTDPSVRYIGPMAQDFWQAFRLAGSDSLSINSIAIDGVNLAAIKALEVRTRELRAAQARTAELESRVAALERLLAGGEEASVLLTRVRQLETRLDALLKQQHDDEAGEIPRVRTAQPDVVPANLPGVTEVRQ